MGVVIIVDFRRLCRMFPRHPIVIVDGGRRLVVQRLVRSTVVVEVDPCVDSVPGFLGIRERVQKHAFILQRPPESLHHHVVAPTTLTIHADRDAMAPQHVQKRGTRELRSLIGVEDPRRPIPLQSLVQGFHAESRVHRVRQPPRQNPPTGPVHHRHQIHMTSTHRQVRDVGSHHTTPVERARAVIVFPMKTVRIR